LEVGNALYMGTALHNNSHRVAEVEVIAATVVFYFILLGNIFPLPKELEQSICKTWQSFRLKVTQQLSRKTVIKLTWAVLGVGRGEFSYLHALLAPQSMRCS